jgi:hypothetical protein
MTDTNQQNGTEQELAAYEKDLAEYLQERIKPGLSRSAIPLLARSIAKGIARSEALAASDGNEPQAGADAQGDEEQPDLEADEQSDAQGDEEQPDLEADEQSDAEGDEEQPDVEADEQSDTEGDEEQPHVEADEQSDTEGDEEQPDVEADEQSDTEGDEEQPDFEANMYELQADLGDEWILHFTVKGEKGWLTAEREDGSQRVEAPDAQSLVTIVDAIDECGGRQP